MEHRVAAKGLLASHSHRLPVPPQGPVDGDGGALSSVAPESKHDARLDYGDWMISRDPAEFEGLECLCRRAWKGLVQFDLSASQSRSKAGRSLPVPEFLDHEFKDDVQVCTRLLSTTASTA